MEENGTFVALIAVNLGIIGLLVTYALAKHFFYSERINDLDIEIEIDFKYLKSKLSQVASFYKDEGHEEKKKLFMYDLNILESEASGQIQVLFLIDHWNTGEDKNEAIDKLIKNSLKLFEHLEQGVSELSFMNIMKICKTGENLKYSKEGLLTELEDSVFNFNSIEKVLYENDHHTRKNLYQSSIDVIGDDKKEKTLIKINYSLINSDIIRAREIINTVSTLIKKIKKSESLSQHKIKTLAIKIETNIIISSSIFGIISPLLCISFLPYNSYINNFSYDISILVAWALTLISLVPYTWVLAKLSNNLRK
ncbi:MAG: hypothetical protein ACPGUE_08605 [Marinomonas sp.]